LLNKVRYEYITIQIMNNDHDGNHVHHPDGISKPIHLKTQVFNDYNIIWLLLIFFLVNGSDFSKVMQSLNSNGQKRKTTK